MRCIVCNAERDLDTSCEKCCETHGSARDRGIYIDLPIEDDDDDDDDNELVIFRAKTMLCNGVTNINWPVVLVCFVVLLRNL